MRFNDLCSDILSGVLLVLIVAACLFIASGLQNPLNNLGPRVRPHFDHVRTRAEIDQCQAEAHNDKELQDCRN